MNKSSFSLGFLLGLLLASILFSFLDSGEAAFQQGSRQLKVAHNLPTEHPVHQSIQHFAERVAFHSKGRIQMTVFPNGQLGSDTQALEQLQSGTLDVAKIGAATLGNFVSLAKVFSLPYLFEDEAHYWRVLEGKVGKDILAALGNSSKGFQGLVYYDAGSRNFYGDKAILEPSDLKRLKIRVMNDPVAIETVKALGASPTPISWGELYTALQQGVVDGAENNPPSFVSSRHFEVCKEFSFDHHSRIPDILLISEKTWHSLEQEEKTWIQKAAEESADYQREAWNKAVGQALKTMKAEGVRIHQVDTTPFRQVTESVRDHFTSGELQSWVERIQKETSP